jgi:Flp pilus assembly protein TadD
LWTHTIACTTANDVAQCNLGFAFRQSGKVEEAITHYKLALQINPNYAEVHNNLGNALVQQGRAEEAIRHYQQALQINPNYADAHHNLGTALQQKGRAAEAISQYQQALQIEPANKEVQNNLAWLLATCADASLRNGHKAVELARQANELSGGADPGILDTLAAALAEAGRFSEARRTAQKAMELARAAGQKELVEELTVELKRYEAGLPCRP